MTPEMRVELGKAVYAVAAQVQTDARVSITTGAVSGNNHVPSAPGTPPNNDTGHLADSIMVERVDELTARVVATAEYAAIQELGGTINHPGGTPYYIDAGGLAVFVSNTSSIAQYLPRTKPHRITLPERPFMRPAALKNEANGKKLMKAAVDRVIKGGKL